MAEKEQSIHAHAGTAMREDDKTDPALRWLALSEVS
jgi:hypothetical protein